MNCNRIAKRQAAMVAEGVKVAFGAKPDAALFDAVCEDADDIEKLEENWRIMQAQQANHTER